jgi:hypothetical protein
VSATQEGPPPQVVDVVSGQKVGFYLVVNTVPVDGVGCSEVSSMSVTPPGATGSLPIDESLSVCGGSVGVYAVEPLSSLGS